MRIEDLWTNPVPWNPHCQQILWENPVNPVSLSERLPTSSQLPRSAAAALKCGPPVPLRSAWKVGCGPPGGRALPHLRQGRGSRANPGRKVVPYTAEQIVAAFPGATFSVAGGANTSYSAGFFA